MLSSITLAQIGLGSVHGLTAPLDAFFPYRTARRAVDALLTGRNYRNRENAWEAFRKLLTRWTLQMELPKLARYGIRTADIDHIVANSRGSSMKTNPITLTDQEIQRILGERN